MPNNRLNKDRFPTKDTTKLPEEDNGNNSHKILDTIKPPEGDNGNNRLNLTTVSLRFNSHQLRNSQLHSLTMVNLQRNHSLVTVNSQRNNRLRSRSLTMASLKSNNR